MKELKQYVCYFYYTMCVFLTVAMTMYGVQIYLLDKDVSAIGFKTFNLQEDYIYPAITFCFEPQFSKHAFEKIGKELNTSIYKDFLDGFIWQHKLLGIDYDNVTIKIHDNILGSYISSFWTTDGYAEYLYNPNNYSELTPPWSYGISKWHRFTPKYYISFRDSVEKCLSVNIPNNLDVRIRIFAILFNASIFPEGKRSNDNIFRIEMHYPNQYFSSKMRKDSWKSQNGENDFTMNFELQNIIVLNMRNKRRRSCNEIWRNDDQIAQKRIMDRVGCQPTHWKEFDYLPICTTKEQMHRFAWMSLEEETFPCKKIQKVIYAYKELDYVKKDWFELPKNECGRFFKVSIEFDDSMFMEIQHIRAFDSETLIGNAGGYLGLFTGYTLMQLPQLIQFLVKYIYKFCHRDKHIR